MTEKKSQLQEVSEVQKMDIAEWHAALSRGELWMFVDQHWEEAAPEGLTDLEWDQHFAALVTAKTGIVPETGPQEMPAVTLVCRR